MSFIWPPMLLALALIPIGLLLLRVMGGRRRRRLTTYGGAGRAQETSRSPARLRSRIPAALLLGGLVVTTVGLARPQAVVSLPREEGMVILAFDVSASMSATDLAPTRMAAAIAAAKDFVAREPASVSIGVVAFSDSGVSVQTPTNDQASVSAAIDRLAPQKGTSVAQGILASLNVIAVAEAGPWVDYYTNQTPAPTATPTPVPAGTHAPAVIVLLTDGENNESPDPAAAAKTAANLGVRIYTVGIGSAAGTNLNLNGFLIHTQLDEATLQQISQITGGTYYGATDAEQLRAIYDNLDTQLVLQPEMTELTAIFAGVGGLLLLAAALTSLLWLGRLP
ncbi:MAG TPA: VWA domain-containing protein [Candidatus Limnocylindrales bacterium]|nr:VWA domain-containing protein [Candidatus Limnocylindrales bacterium]